MSEAFDVIIIGGGLAGCLSALPLAQAGKTVALIEKAAFPRDKVCGEGLLPYGVFLLRQQGLGFLLDECLAQPFRGIFYRAYDIWAPGDFAHDEVGFGFQRSVFDAKLHEYTLAQKGIQLFKQQACGIVQDKSGVEVFLKKTSRVKQSSLPKKLRGKVLIGADGVHSTTRHLLELDGGSARRKRYGLRRHYRLAEQTPMPERVEVTVFDECELFITPVAPGVINVAFLLEREKMQNSHGKPNERFELLFKNAPQLLDYLKGATPLNNVKVTGPLMTRVKKVHRGRSVLVGDAAGFVDAVTGEGMTMALASAAFCHESVLAILAGAAPQKCFEDYAKKRNKLFRDHQKLTLGLLAIAGQKTLIRRAVARLKEDPQLFSLLLEVNNGTRRLHKIGLWNLFKLGLGKNPSTSAKKSGLFRK